jgi:dTDP-4-amino-4,6-dideoxygalactose transaminase
MLTPECLSIDWKTEGIRAVIPVATFGMPQNAQAWSDWSLTHRIPVILDAAGAFGAQSSFGDIPVVISMHATKALSSGEGGLVFTENAALAQRLTQMTNFGIGPQSKLGGTNAKLSEFHAAVGHADLDVWSVKAQQRMDLYSKYKKILLLSCESRMGFQMDTGLTSPTMMVVQFKSPDQRDEAEQACQALGIQTRRWYQPLIQEHPALSGVLEAFPTPQARDLSKLLLGLPFFLGMSEIDLREIASTLSG